MTPMCAFVVRLGVPAAKKIARQKNDAERCDISFI